MSIENARDRKVFYGSKLFKPSKNEDDTRNGTVDRLSRTRFARFGTAEQDHIRSLRLKDTRQLRPLS